MVDWPENKATGSQGSQTNRWEQLDTQWWADCSLRGYQAMSGRQKVGGWPTKIIHIDQSIPSISMLIFSTFWPAYKGPFVSHCHQTLRTDNGLDTRLSRSSCPPQMCTTGNRGLHWLDQQQCVTGPILTLTVTNNSVSVADYRCCRNGLIQNKKST